MGSGSDKKKTAIGSDDNKGMTRRDFVGNTLIGSGAALLTAAAPGTVMAAGGTGAPNFRLGHTMALGSIMRKGRA